jgi:hypothetical protein
VADAIKVTPVLSEIVNDTIRSFFPKGNWINLVTDEGLNVTSEEGEYHDIRTGLSTMKHLRPGYTIVTQDITGTPLNTKMLETAPIMMKINLDQSLSSQGTILMGNISESNVTEKILSTKSSISTSSHTSQNLTLASIKIFGHPASFSNP